MRDFGICKWSCERGYCPDPCVEKGVGGPATVLIDTAIWSTTAPAIPKVSCVPPCVLVLPPYKIGSISTIQFPPVTKTITEKWNYFMSKTTVITITFAPITTSEVSKEIIKMWTLVSPIQANIYGFV